MKCKPLFVCFSLLAGLGLSAVIGCVRDGDNIGNPVEVSIEADKPQINNTHDDGSGEPCVQWCEGSRIGVFACSRTNERWEFGNNSCFGLTETDGAYGLFSGNLYLGAYIDQDEEHEITYHAYYPYRTYRCSKGVFSAVIPDLQYPSANFSDPEADFLMGSTLETNAPLGRMEKDGGFVPLHFGFTRSVAPIRLSISDIPVEKQKIEKMVFRIEGANLAGRVNVDLGEGTFAIDENESSDCITLVYRNGEILAEGFDAWLSICPATARSFSLLIETEDYIITDEFDAGEDISFTAGRLVRIPVGLASAGVASKPKPEEGTVFSEVKSQSDDFSGKYLIVCNDRAMGAELIDKGSDSYNIAGIDISAMKNAAGSYVFPDGEPGYVYTIAKLEGAVSSFDYTIYNESIGYIRANQATLGRIIAAPDYSHEYAKWNLSLNADDGMIDIKNPKELITGNYFLRWDDVNEEFMASTGSGIKVGLFRLSEAR